MTRLWASRSRFWAVVFALVLCVAGTPRAQNVGGYADPQAPGTVSTATPRQLAGVGFKQHLNSRLPLDAAFMDEMGYPVELGCRRTGGAKRASR